LVCEFGNFLSNMKTNEMAFRRMMERAGITEEEIVKRGGKIGNGVYEMPDEEHRKMMMEHHAQIRASFAMIPMQPDPPTAVELATNFAGAMARWAAAGFKTVDKETLDKRTEVCESCEFWDGAARLGAGLCRSPGCGCTSFKRWLVSENCPLNKWPK